MVLTGEGWCGVRIRTTAVRSWSTDPAAPGGGSERFQNTSSLFPYFLRRSSWGTAAETAVIPVLGSPEENWNLEEWPGDWLWATQAAWRVGRACCCGIWTLPNPCHWLGASPPAPWLSLLCQTDACFPCEMWALGDLSGHLTKLSKHQFSPVSPTSLPVFFIHSFTHSSVQPATHRTWPCVSGLQQRAPALALWKLFSLSCETYGPPPNLDPTICFLEIDI